MATRDELKAAFPSLGPGWDAAIDAGIDVSLILENLDLSPTARVQLLESLLSESQALRASVQFRLEAPRAVFGPDADRIVRFRELLRRLHEAHLDFIVVGGVAATIHGVAEPTRDLDVCIRLNAATWKQVAQVLEPLNPRFALTIDRRPVDLSQIDPLENLYALTDLGRLDFITDVSPLGDFDQLLQHVELFEVDGVELKVLSRRALIQVKEHVARPKDLEVARALRAIDDAYSSRS